MSSKTQIEKQCEHCGERFTAKMLTTRYCCHLCNQRAYKAIKRAEKIKAAKQGNKPKLYIQVDSREFLTIAETCNLLSVSRVSLWRYLKADKLKAVRIGKRVIIRRKDIEQLFEHKK